MRFCVPRATFSFVLLTSTSSTDTDCCKEFTDDISHITPASIRPVRILCRCVSIKLSFTSLFSVVIFGLRKSNSASLVCSRTAHRRDYTLGQLCQLFLCDTHSVKAL